MNMTINATDWNATQEEIKILKEQLGQAQYSLDEYGVIVDLYAKFTKNSKQVEDFKNYLTNVMNDSSEVVCELNTYIWVL